MKKRPLMSSTRRITRENAKLYLLQHNIPPQRVNELLYVFTSDAIEEADRIIYDRVYSLTALMLHDVLGFGAKRIFKCLEYMSKRMHDVSAVKGDWSTYAGELREKTGIVVNSDSENRMLMEYQGMDIKTGKEIPDE